MKTLLVILFTSLTLIGIDIVSFSVWENINYFNLSLEFIVFLLVLYPYFSIQKYRNKIFYKYLNLGYFLLFLSYFVDAIDQIFDHNLYYTVIMEKLSLIIAIVLIFIGGKKWMENYQALSWTDELTQLPNRKQLQHLIEFEMKRCNDTHEVFSFCIIDIDHFKKVNDDFGHLNGDKILVEFSNNLKSLMRENDIFGRWGGEEFVLVIKNTKIVEAEKILNRIRESVENHTITFKGNSQKITASFGVCEFNGEDFQQIFSMADKALYQAKEQGRNRVVAI